MENLEKFINFSIEEQINFIEQHVDSIEFLEGIINKVNFENIKQILDGIENLDILNSLFYRNQGDLLTKILSKIILENSLDNPEKTALYLKYLNEEKLLEIILTENSLAKSALVEIKNENQLNKIIESEVGDDIKSLAINKLNSIDYLKQLLKDNIHKNKKIFQATNSRIEKLKMQQKEKEENEKQYNNLKESLLSHLENEMIDNHLTSRLELFQQKFNKLKNNIPNSKIDDVRTLLGQLNNKVLKTHEINQTELSEVKVEKIEKETDKEFLNNLRLKKFKFVNLEQLLEHKEKIKKILLDQNLTLENNIIESSNQYLNFLSWEIANFDRALKLTELIKQINSDYISQTNGEDLIKQVIKIDEFHKELLDITRNYSFSFDEVFMDFIHSFEQYLKYSVELQEKTKIIENNIILRLSDVESELELGNYLKQAKKLNKIKKKLELIDKYKADVFNKTIQRLFHRIEQLQNLHLSVVYPKQEKLCEKMETLANSNLEPKQILAEIKNLQTEWKQLSKGVEKQKFWTRFHEANQIAFEKCKAFVDEHVELIKQNTERRFLIIDKLKNYLATTNWENPNWQDVYLYYKNTWHEWKHAAPFNVEKLADYKDNFKNLINQFEKKLNIYYAMVAERKQALIDKAIKLSELEDINEAIRRCKNLQLQWQANKEHAGNKETDLWQKFNHNCSLIFKKRNKEIRKQKNKIKAVNKKADSICKTLDKISSLNNNELFNKKDEIQQLEKDFNELDLSELSLNNVKKIKYLFNKSLNNSKNKLKRASHNEKLNQKNNLINLVMQLNGFKLEGNVDSNFITEVENKNIDSKYKKQILSIIEKINDSQLAVKIRDNALHDICLNMEIDFNLDSPEEDYEKKKLYKLQNLTLFNQRKDKVEAKDEFMKKHLSFIIDSKIDNELKFKLSNRFLNNLLKIN